MKFHQIKEQSKILVEKSKKEPRVMIGCATCGMSVGALQTAEVFKNIFEKYNIPCNIIKVGCIGLCYAEPFVIIEKEDMPSICYKNITPELAEKLAHNYFLQDDPCFDLAIGTLEKKDDGTFFIPELERFEKEKRIILKHSGIINPEDINEYIYFGGYEGLNKSLGMKSEEIISEIKKSGLRGLGGAGFQVGVKWERCLASDNFPKYVICNADEGDPGAFGDRVVIESSPHQIIEGMIIAGKTLNTKYGYIYIRSEYPLAIERLTIALSQAREKNLLGKNILESNFSFDIEIFVGAGAFVCGESTSLMYSIEGKRPMPRVRPPRSTEKGLWGKPTLLNNVKTFACIPQIILQGGEWFSGIGTENSKGTTVFALAGKIKNSGLCEVPMGTTLKEIIEIGGGIKDNKRIKAIQIGGPSGGCIPFKFQNTPIDFDSLNSLGSMMGSGGLIVLDETSCMVDVAKYFISFLKKESCGKCSFCRIGIEHLYLLIDNISKGEGKIQDLDLLLNLSEDIKNGSLCGLGKTAPNPVITTIKYFKDEYIAHIVEKKCPALVCRDLISYYILQDKCYRGCEHCVLTCPAKAITQTEDRIKVIDQSKCIKCGICFEVCPKDYNAVIKLSPKIKND